MINRWLLKRSLKFKAIGASLALIGALNLSGCGTVASKDLSNIKMGMTKAEVIDATGGPNRKFREEGKDHWVYQMSHDQKDWSQVISFANGKVVKIGKPFTKDQAAQELEDTNSLEEYEAKAKALQKNRAAKSKKFKNLND